MPVPGSPQIAGPLFKAVGGKTGVWSPGYSPASPPAQTEIITSSSVENIQEVQEKSQPSTPLSPVWKPSVSGSSQELDKPQFKSVKLDTSLKSPQENGINKVHPLKEIPFPDLDILPAENNHYYEDQPQQTSPGIKFSLKRSASAGANQPIYANVDFDSSPPTFTRVNFAGIGLPPSQSPTVTLLQKAREGQLPRGASYIDNNTMDSKENRQPFDKPWLNDQFRVKSEEYLPDRKVTTLQPVKYEGIGPTVLGVPISLCSGVKEENKGEWYKRMYKSLHRTAPQDEYEVVKYQKRGRTYHGQSGYMSEPEPERNDEHGGRRYGTTLDRRKNRNDFYMYELANGSKPKKPPNVWNPPSARYSSDIYKNQPKRIEDYEPGHSSIAEMEAKMDDNAEQRPLTYLYNMMTLNGSSGHRQNDVPLYRPPTHHRPYLFKDGYESDSTLVYHKRGAPDSLSQDEQRAWYREFQKGGDIPLGGFRRTVPEKSDGELPTYKCMTRPLKPNAGNYQWWPPRSIYSDSDHRQGFPLPRSDSLPNLISRHNLLTPTPPNICFLPPETEFEPESESDSEPERPHLPVSVIVQCFSQLDHEISSQSLDKSNVLAQGDSQSPSKSQQIGSSTADVRLASKSGRKNTRWWSPTSRFSASLPRIDDIDDTTLPANILANSETVFSPAISTTNSDLSSLSQTDVNDEGSLKSPINFKQLDIPNLAIEPPTPTSATASDIASDITTETVEELDTMEPHTTPENEINDDPETLQLFNMASSAVSLSCLSVLDQVLRTMTMANISNDILRDQPHNVFQFYQPVMFDAKRPTVSTVEIRDVTPTDNTLKTVSENDEECCDDGELVENDEENDIVEPPEMFSSKSDVNDDFTNETENIEECSVAEKIAIFEAIEDQANFHDGKLFRAANTLNLSNSSFAGSDSKSSNDAICQDCEGNHLRVNEAEIETDMQNSDTENEENNEEQIPYIQLLEETEEISAEVNSEPIVQDRSRVRFKELNLRHSYSLGSSNGSEEKCLRSPTNKERLAAAAIKVAEEDKTVARRMSPERQQVRHMLSRSLDSLTNKNPPSIQMDKAAYMEYLLSFMRAPHITERFNRLRNYYGTLERISSVEMEYRKFRRSVSVLSVSVPELKHLYNTLDIAQRNKEFLYKAEGSIEIDRERWTQNSDRFLSYRSQSVNDLRRVWMDHLESERMKLCQVTKLNQPAPIMKLKTSWEQITSPNKPDGDFIEWSDRSRMCRSVSVIDLVGKFNEIDEFINQHNRQHRKLSLGNKPWSKYSSVEAKWQNKIVKQQMKSTKQWSPSAVRTKKSKSIDMTVDTEKDMTWPLKRSSKIHEFNPECAYGIIKFETQPPPIKERKSLKKREPRAIEDEEMASRSTIYSSHEAERFRDKRNHLSPSPPPSFHRSRSSSNSEVSLHEMDGNGYRNDQRNLVASGNGKKQDVFISQYFSPGYVPLRTQSSWELSGEVLKSPPFNYKPETDAQSLQQMETTTFKSAGNLNQKVKIVAEKPKIIQSSLKKSDSSIEDLNQFKKGDVKKLALKFDSESHSMMHPQLANSKPNMTGWSYITGSNVSSPVQPRVTDFTDEKPVTYSRPTSAVVNENDNVSISYQPVGKSLQRLIRTFEADKIVRWLFGNHEKITPSHSYNSPSDFLTGHHRSNHVSQLKHHYEHVPRSEQLSRSYRHRHHVPASGWRYVKTRSDQSWIRKPEDNQFWVVPGPSGSSPNLLVDFEATDQPVYGYSSSIPDGMDNMSDLSYSPRHSWHYDHDHNNNTEQRNKARMPDIRLFSPRKYDRSPTNFRRMCRSEEYLKPMDTPEMLDCHESGNTGTWPSYLRSHSKSMTGAVRTGITRFSDNLETNRSYTYSPLITSTPTLSPKRMSPDVTSRYYQDRRRQWEPLYRSSWTPSPPPRCQPTSRRMPTYKDWKNLEKTIDETRKELEKVEFGFPIPPPKVALINPDSPYRFQDSEVNIHYRSPIINIEKDYVSDEEIRRRQDFNLKQIYEDERRKKTLLEMADIDSRRHTDNFVPAQKSPIALDRYEHLYEDTVVSLGRTRTPEPKMAGKALHSFRALNSRELSFNKGDIVLINRKIDKNWYEGEHNGMIGIFPVNHVEIIPYESVKVTTKKPTEGMGKVKYNFQGQTNLELSLVKGETVVLTRKVDHNWYEGRVGSLKGIFPASYVDVITEPGTAEVQVSKPVASPVSHSLIKNGNAISPQPQTENSLNQSNIYNSRSPSNYIDATRRYGSANKSMADQLFDDRKLPLDQTLHIHTQNEPIRYRAIYSYKPQNDDELELQENDVVFVMEKCNDGWFVGSSQKTGLFGTFPGNYVERICEYHRHRK